MKKYILRIIPNNEEVAQMYRNHTHYNKGDSGIDLFATEQITIGSWETGKIKFNISCEVICQEEDGSSRNVSYYLYARSSISKTSLRLANNVGIIDAFYRGNIMAVCDNISTVDYVVEKGVRLFQLTTPDLSPFHEVVVVDSFLDASKNRKGGFGSTGK